MRIRIHTYKCLKLPRKHCEKTQRHLLMKNGKYYILISKSKSMLNIKGCKFYC